MNEIISLPVFITFFAICLIGIFLVTRWIYFDAKYHGMNPWPWVLFVALISPNFLGLIIYMLVRSRLATSVKCSACGVGIPKRARFCPNCGAKNISSETLSTKKISARSLILGIVMITSFIVMTIVAIGMGALSKAPKETTTTYTAGYAGTNIGNSWDVRFRTLTGVKQGTFKAKSENPVLIYSSEITKGTATFVLLDANGTSVATIEPNTSGEIPNLTKGEKYTVTVSASDAGGSFSFKMK